MKPIKYAILLLAVLVLFSSAAEAKKAVTVRDYRGKSRSDRRRDKEREAKRLREQRDKAIEAQKKRNEKRAEYIKKKKAEVAAKEKERLDKTKETVLARQKKEIEAAKTAREEEALLGKYATMVTEVRMIEHPVGAIEVREDPLLR